MNNNRNGKIILVLIILTILFTIIGGSLAYLSWISSEAQKTVVNFTTEMDFSCAVDGGGNITSNDAILVPTKVNSSTSANYIKRTIKVMPTINGSNQSIYMDLWLDINKIDSGLSTSENVKYALTTSNDSNTTGVIVSGTFHNKKVNDKILLLDSKSYSSSTTDTYYLWIWIDEAQTSLETTGQTFNLSLNGSCTNKLLPYSEDILNGGYPQLDDGMIPVVISDTGVVETISHTDSNWYSYSNKEWANAILVSSSSRSKYLNTSGVEVSENDILAYYVWIPRYKYKIWTTGNSSVGNEQEIDIIFENKKTTKTLGTKVGEYRTHPAFTFGDTELNGIWVGKFETTGTADAPTVKPNISSLRSQKISAQFTTSRILGTNTYGSTSKMNAHMMKNSEWGAVVFLSHSKYGVNREVYINNSSGFYTGRSGGNVGGSTAINTVYTVQTSTTQYNSYGFYTWDGYLLEYDTDTKTATHDISKVASTTGNITGVYDMSGGAYEYVMGVFTNSSGQLWSGNSATNNSGFTGLVSSSGDSYTGVDFPDGKYYDIYKAASGTSINILTACDGGICYGHGLSEVKGWYNDSAYFVVASEPWLRRGGYYGFNANAGAFGFSYGGGSSGYGFRSVISYVG